MNYNEHYFFIQEHDALLADSKKDKDTLSKLEVAAQVGQDF